MENLDSLSVTMQQRATVHNKDVVIAETAYPLPWIGMIIPIIS